MHRANNTDTGVLRASGLPATGQLRGMPAGRWPLPLKLVRDLGGSPSHRPGDTLWQDTAAWLFIVGACAAWYVGAMTMLHDAWRRVILPLGKFSVRANLPGPGRCSRWNTSTVSPGCATASRPDAHGGHRPELGRGL